MEHAERNGRMVQGPILSDMPFTAGASCIERLGTPPSVIQGTVRIVRVDGDAAHTSSGRVYNRWHGGRLPSGQGKYRALHSLGYCNVPYQADKA